MTADSNTDMVATHKVDSFTFCNTSATGNEITNRFDDCYNAMTVIYLDYGTVEVPLKCNLTQKVLGKRANGSIRSILWAATAIILGILLYMFFTTWLPTLKFAFQTAV